jgi:hypothetical protein
VCTLAVSVQSDRRWPLVVAANRDERLGRPAEGWGLRETARGVRYAGPRDLQAGGTWIGVSQHGLFAGVTNFHAPGGGFPDPSRRSRGELVALALDHPSAEAARAALASVEAQRYNPFHLLVSDAAGAFLWRYDGETAGLAPLPPGLHLVTEESAEGLGPRGELVRARWPVDASVGRLRDILSLHAPAAREATCIHLDPHYGTRSSAVIRLAPALGHSELFVADGRPCVSPLEDRSGLLSALARSP